MRLRAKLACLISILFIAAITNALISSQLERQAEKKLFWVTHTHRVIIETELFLSGIQDIEIGQKGYLLTNNPAYLSFYHSGIKQTMNSFKTLLQITQNNKRQQTTLKQIQEEMTERLRILKLTITFAQKGQIQKAINIVKNDLGKRHMDNMRRLLTPFINQEMLNLENRKAEYREFKIFIDLLFYIEIVFILSLGIITFAFLSKNLFAPLNRLVENTHQMERGEKIEIQDMLAKDEIGYLIARFYEMHQKVYSRTKSLEFDASHDPLTGLRNRTTLFENLQAAIKKAVATHTKLAVLYIDIDHFKTINDRYGHDFGDILLQRTANHLSTNTRETDLIFRIGGDEFLILLTDVKTLENLEEIVQKLLSETQKPMLIYDQEITPKISIGIAISPDNSEDSITILKMADKAMYEAKKDTTLSYTFAKGNTVNE